MVESRVVTNRLDPALGTRAAEAQAALEREDWAAAKELCEPLARMGSVRHMLALGRIHDNENDPQLCDYRAARYWYERALNEGLSVEAALGLGRMYYVGRGGDRLRESVFIL